MVGTIYEDLPGGLCGYYDRRTGAIHVDRRMSAKDQANTYVHEMFHKILGHGKAGSLPEHVAREVAVDRITARALVTLPALMDAMVTHPCQQSRAEFLGVDEHIYAARIFGLEPEEQIMVEVCVRRCIGLKLAPVAAAREVVLVA
jgi:hypothetical protein